jgi:WD40 repeat protein
LEAQRMRVSLCFCLFFLFLGGVSTAEPDLYERVFSPGHLTQIRALDWSAGPKMVASLGVDGQVYVWRLDSQVPVLSLHLSQETKGLDLSPDGRRIAVVYQDRVNVHRVEDGSIEVELEDHQDTVNRALFGPLGKTLATTSKDKTARLWPVGAWKEPLVLKHQEVCDAVAFSPDGKTVATCAGWEFGEVQLWRSDDGTPIRKMTLDTLSEKAHPSAYMSPSNALTFSSDGSLLASAEFSGCKVWDVADGLLVQKIGFQNDTGGPGATAVHLDADNQHLQFWDGSRLNIFEMTNGQQVGWRELSSAQVVELLYLDDVTTLVGGLHGELVVENPVEEFWSVRGLEESAEALAFRPGTHRLYGVFNSGRVAEWDASTARLLREVKTETPEIKTFAFLGDGSRLLHGTDDGLAIRDTDSLELLQQMKGHEGTVREVEIDGELAVTASSDRTIGVWDLAEGKLLKRLHGHEDVVVEVALVPGGSQVVSVSEDATVRLWDIESGEELARFIRPERKTPYSAAAVSPDGRTLAVAEAFLAEQPVVVWDLDNKELLRTLTLNQEGSGAMELAFTPDGFLWTADLSGNLALWEPRSGEELARLKGFTGYGWALAESDDGLFVVLGSTGQERAIRFWRKNR